MNDAETNAVQQHIQILVDTLSGTAFDAFLNHVCIHGLINDGEVESINVENLSKNRTWKLLQLLQRKEETWDILCDYLDRNRYGHIATKLKTSHQSFTSMYGTDAAKETTSQSQFQLPNHNDFAATQLCKIEERVRMSFKKFKDKQNEIDLAVTTFNENSKQSNIMEMFLSVSNVAIIIYGSATCDPLQSFHGVPFVDLIGGSLALSVVKIALRGHYETKRDAVQEKIRKIELELASEQETLTNEIKSFGEICNVRFDLAERFIHSNNNMWVPYKRSYFFVLAECCLHSLLPSGALLLTAIAHKILIKVFSSEVTRVAIDDFIQSRRNFDNAKNEAAEATVRLHKAHAAADKAANVAKSSQEKVNTLTSEMRELDKALIAARDEQLDAVVDLNLAASAFVAVNDDPKHAECFDYVRDHGVSAATNKGYQPNDWEVEYYEKYHDCYNKFVNVGIKNANYNTIAEKHDKAVVQINKTVAATTPLEVDCGCRKIAAKVAESVAKNKAATAENARQFMSERQSLLQKNQTTMEEYEKMLRITNWVLIGSAVVQIAFEVRRLIQLFKNMYKGEIESDLAVRRRKWKDNLDKFESDVSKVSEITDEHFRKQKVTDNAKL